MTPIAAKYRKVRQVICKLSAPSCITELCGILITLRAGRLRNRGSILQQEVFLSSEAEAHAASCVTGNNVSSDVGLLSLDAGLLARSQYSECLANGHLDAGFSWFPCA